MVSHCYTELQLLTKFLENQLNSNGLGFESSLVTEDIAVIRCKDLEKTRIRIIQMQKIIKIFLDGKDVHRIWLNHRNFIRPKLTNTFSHGDIINQKQLKQVFRRILSRTTDHIKPSKFQTVMDDPYVITTIFQFLPGQAIRNIQRTNTTLYENCNKQEIYKVVYEKRFGRTGFGQELNWKRYFFNKVG